MNPHTYRRPVRIVERTIQPALLLNDDFNRPAELAATEPLPELREIAVQVKFWFFWIDVWAETCKADDADTIEYLQNSANEVADYMWKSV